jgi:hypothetical protein
MESKLMMLLRSGGSKVLRICAMVASLFGLSACTEGYEKDDVRLIAAYLLSGTPPKDYIPPEMQVLCDAEGGREVTKIYNVEGYAIARRTDLHPIEEIANGVTMTSGQWGGCFPCLSELVEQGFDYVEATYQSAEGRYQIAKEERRIAMDEGNDLYRNSILSRRSFHDLYSTETGLYRYSLADRLDDNALCSAFDEALRKARIQEGYFFARPELTMLLRDYRRTRKELGNRCVVATKVDAFKGPYLLETNQSRVLDASWWFLSGYVSKHREALVDRQSGFTAAQAIKFQFHLHLGGPHFRSWSSCGSTSLPPLKEIMFSKATEDDA